MILILLIIQLSRTVDLRLSKAQFLLVRTLISCRYIVFLETLFSCSFFCSLDQSCKTLQTVQVAPTQNKEVVGSAFHFEQNITSRECMPGRDLYLVWNRYETSCNYSCRKSKICFTWIFDSAAEEWYEFYFIKNKIQDFKICINKIRGEHTYLISYLNSSANHQEFSSNSDICK